MLISTALSLISLATASIENHLHPGNAAARNRPSGIIDEAYLQYCTSSSANPQDCQRFQEAVTHELYSPSTLCAIRQSATTAPVNVSQKLLSVVLEYGTSAPPFGATYDFYPFSGEDEIRGEFLHMFHNMISVSHLLCEISYEALVGRKNPPPPSQYQNPITQYLGVMALLFIAVYPCAVMAAILFLCRDTLSQYFSKVFGAAIGGKAKVQQGSDHKASDEEVKDDDDVASSNEFWSTVE